MDLIRYEEVTDIDVSRSLAHGLVAILFYTDRTLIVLEHNVCLGRIALGFQELFGPKDLGHAVVDCH